MDSWRHTHSRETIVGDACKGDTMNAIFCMRAPGREAGESSAKQVHIDIIKLFAKGRVRNLNSNYLGGSLGGGRASPAGLRRAPLTSRRPANRCFLTFMFGPTRPLSPKDTPRGLGAGGAEPIVFDSSPRPAFAAGFATVPRTSPAAAAKSAKGFDGNLIVPVSKSSPC